MHTHVRYATGDSDSDTVRDWDSGAGKIKKWKREPYLYRIERNMNEVNFRRRMKPTFEETPKAGVVGLHFETEVETDSDDEVKQASFILPPGILVDSDTGEMRARRIFRKARRPI